MVASRSELEELYRREDNPVVKERLLLILRVEGDGAIPARVARELHRSRPWTSFWLTRYEEEGVEGLRDKPRSGRPSRMSEEVQAEIRRELSSRKQGWTTEQVTQLIEERGKVRYHFTHVYRLMHRWDSRRRSRRGGTSTPPPSRRKRISKNECGAAERAPSGVRGGLHGRVLLHLRLAGEEGLDRGGLEAGGHGHRITQALGPLRGAEPGRETALQAVR
jgi:putative transposase